jgi:hypothetical protein
MTLHIPSYKLVRCHCLASDQTKYLKDVLDVPTIFTHGKGVGDIRIWHKWVGHVNLQRFKLMEKTKSC